MLPPEDELRPSEGSINVGRLVPDEEFDPRDGAGFTVGALLFDPLGRGALTPPGWPDRDDEELPEPDTDGAGVTGALLPNDGREITVGGEPERDLLSAEGVEELPDLGTETAERPEPLDGLALGEADTAGRGAAGARVAAGGLIVKLREPDGAGRTDGA